jgi:hypothetical protein
MQEDHESISKLLRLKRFEQPPPEYYENFLQEFKDRQRSELLREPAWRIAWERLCAFFGEQLPARIGYTLATSGVLVAAAIASFHIVESRPLEVVAAPEQRPAQPAYVNLDASQQIQLSDLLSRFRRLAPTASPPRYVMDARPVSYEPPSSF